MRRQQSIVALANTMVPIDLVCQWIGMSVPEVTDRLKSVKVHCPFGEVYHDDSGAEPAFRFYPEPNNAWCFACGEFFTPVSLAAKAWDRDADSTAAELLDRVGYKPASFAQHWRELAKQPEPDLDALHAALQLWCDGEFPGWDEMQYTGTIAEYFSRCLGLLIEVRTEDDGRQWLRCCKQVMTEVVGKVV